MTARHLTCALSVVAAVLVAAACQEATRAEPGPNFGNTPPPPPKGGGCANFRLTGGGRTDQRDHQGYLKNTPGSHDFATFGFQARPDKDCPYDNAGSGQQEWNEHGTNHEFGAPFAFHGRVTFFTATDGEGQCGQYGGSGRLNFHSGDKIDNVSFTVTHACDVQEPGVGHDHIAIEIGPIGNPPTTYHRHGLLSGGNIQWHRLTGNQ